MVSVMVMLVALPMSPSASASMPGVIPSEPLAAVEDERDEHLVPALRERSKKERWLREKACRPDVRIDDGVVASTRERKENIRGAAAKTPISGAESRLSEPLRPVGARLEPVATLFNVWNRDALPLVSGLPYKKPFQLFLRDHYTREWTQADTRLATILAAAALKFRVNRIDVVSGYRSPKYNLMLRKKGHQVARESQHTQGTAVDFRIKGVPTETLREFVRGLRQGGVGYYPHTRFIHADTGKIRYWQGS